MAATAEMARAREKLYAILRADFAARGSLEVETPIAVPVAGQEPHLRPFGTRFTPDLPVPAGGVEIARKLHLHTSPEYAMKRLLARPGFARIHQFARVFRDGEISRSHNPEFTLLEFYVAPGDAALIMRELEEMIAAAAEQFSPTSEQLSAGALIDLRAPYQRLTCQDAFVQFTGFDPWPMNADALAEAARHVGVRVPQGANWDDAFTQVLLEKIEPQLGRSRPVYLCEYPASQAALAKRKRSDPRVAERFELYAGGLELCNGFSELTDADEQRARFLEEQALRKSLGREQFPLDEDFLAALPKLPPTGGVAVGIDRLLMLLTGARDIAEVLLFPAAEEYPQAPLAADESIAAGAGTAR